MTRKQSVRAIVINGDKLLAMKRNKFGNVYYTLIGGGIAIGENAEGALRRELREETGMEVGEVREVFVEDAGDLYGVQHVFLCEYTGGDPVLSPTSEEALISAMGKNLYEPLWLPLDQVLQVPFRSKSVAEALIAGAHGGFPEMAQELAFEPESMAR
ncbi:MAG TPA: NUDIX domain-containing protein [Candidatus Saccharimonadia bacterium]|nr:NUDIX domain-containing protein [Candidatus Saccharimonadia bacterium]